MWKSIRTGRVLTSVFEQSDIVISVRVRATVTGVHNLNSSSFCDHIEINYRAYSDFCQGQELRQAKAADSQSGQPSGIKIFV